MPEIPGRTSKRSLVHLLGLAGSAFGAAGLVAPGTAARLYRIPPTPHGRQLIRLLGSRIVALGVWTLTARTDEEIDRLLLVAAGSNALDAAIGLGSRDTGATRPLTVASTAPVVAAALALRRRKG